MLRRGAIVAALLLSAVLVVGAAVFVLGAYRVDGASMAPTLADGELIAANPLARSPARFDVVVLRPTAGGQPVVKRVVGLPGDRIQIAPAPGGPRIRVTPSGTSTWLDVRRGPAGPWRTRIECCAPDGRTSARPAPATVPAGSYFVLGDNPDESVDSRTFGWAEADAVRAVVLGRAWPPAALPAPPALAAAR